MRGDKKVCRKVTPFLYSLFKRDIEDLTSAHVLVNLLNKFGGER